MGYQNCYNCYASGTLCFCKEIVTDGVICKNVVIYTKYTMKALVRDGVQIDENKKHFL